MPKVSKEKERPILYPKVKVAFKWAGAEGPIDAAWAKKALGWETEAEMRKRVGSETAVFDEDELMVFTDLDGNRVACHHNDRNRPFSFEHSAKLAQEILCRNWAGPTIDPALTVNGEAIIISLRGRVESGQHRLIAQVLADQEYDRNRAKWATLWPDSRPVMESVVVLGVSEEPKVIRTLDNVRPRSLSDVLFTSDEFSDLGNTGRRECSRMLDAAIDLLWKRTGAGVTPGGKYYQTHAASLEFLDRHKTLRKCVRQIFNDNQERSISKLRLSPGQCSCCLYLMASSESDVDMYRNAKTISEKSLDWSQWDKAVEFWAALASDKQSIRPLRAALSLLGEEEYTGTKVKLALLAHAWASWKENGKVTKDDLQLEWSTDDDGVKVLTDSINFGGIDLGDDKEPTPSEEEVEEAKQAVRKEAFLLPMRAKEEVKYDPKPLPTKAKSGLSKELEEVRALPEAKGLLLLFVGATGATAYEEDAECIHEKLGKKIETRDGLKRISYPLSVLDNIAQRLTEEGHKVGLVKSTNGSVSITRWKAKK